MMSCLTTNQRAFTMPLLYAGYLGCTKLLSLPIGGKVNHGQ